MQMLLFLFIILFFLFIITLFAFPKFSPIPYFPTNKYDLPAIIQALNLKNDQVIFDLGAGDGIVIFNAASVAYKKNLNTQFIAVDINPVLIIILYIRRLLHPNRRNIKIVWGDMFKINLKSQMLNVKSTCKNLKPKKQLTIKQYNNITIYLYISPWLLEKVIENLKLKIKNFSVVSYFYPVKSLKKNEQMIKGKNNVFIYSVNNRRYTTSEVV